MNIFKNTTLMAIMSLSLLNNVYSINTQIKDKTSTTEINSSVSSESIANNKLIIILEEIKTVLENYDNIEKEITAINPIKLKNFTGIGLLKNFKGQITFTELKTLKSLQNNFNDQSSLEILKYIFGFIITKASEINDNNKEKKTGVSVDTNSLESEINDNSKGKEPCVSVDTINLEMEEKLASLIEDIKNLINKHFKVNLELRNLSLNTPDSLSTTFEHPTVKKIIEISKTDTEKLKEFSKYLFEKILPANSEAKKSLEVIINEIDYLLSL